MKDVSQSQMEPTLFETQPTQQQQRLDEVETALNLRAASLVAKESEKQKSESPRKNHNLEKLIERMKNGLNTRDLSVAIPTGQKIDQSSFGEYPSILLYIRPCVSCGHVLKSMPRFTQLEDDENEVATVWEYIPYQKTNGQLEYRLYYGSLDSEASQKAGFRGLTMVIATMIHQLSTLKPTVESLTIDPLYGPILQPCKEKPTTSSLFQTLIQFIKTRMSSLGTGLLFNAYKTIFQHLLGSLERLTDDVNEKSVISIDDQINVLLSILQLVNVLTSDRDPIVCGCEEDLDATIVKIKNDDRQSQDFAISKSTDRVHSISSVEIHHCEIKVGNGRLGMDTLVGNQCILYQSKYFEEIGGFEGNI